MGGGYLIKQIESILAQTVNKDFHVEIIISDDGSDDGSIELVQKQYQEADIKIYKHVYNKKKYYYQKLLKITDNFGNALRHATGNYIFLCDQDDIWYPEKIRKGIQALNGYDFCTHDFHLIDANDNPYSILHMPNLNFTNLCKHGEVYGFTIGMRADAMRKILPMPEVPQHDTFISLIATIDNNMAVIKEPLAAHRWLGGNFNNSNNGIGIPLLVKVYYRLKMITIVIFRKYFSFRKHR